MTEPPVRVRRATPGDVDGILSLLSTLQGRDRPSADRVQYVFSLIVTEPSIEIYVAEAANHLAGVLAVYYLEFLARGGLAAVIPEVVVQSGPLQAQALSGLLERARRAAGNRRCRRLDLYVSAGDEALASVAQDIGFLPSAQGLSLRVSGE